MRFTDFEPIDTELKSKTSFAAVTAELDPGSPDSMREIAETAFLVLRNEPEIAALSEAEAAMLAVRISYQVAYDLGGGAIYISKGTAMAHAKTERAIIEKFTGNNIREIARAHRITEMRVRQILNTHLTKARDARLAQQGKTP